MTKFYLTTAIDYVNSRPHLGTAYEKVTADVIARFKRLAGYDTHFLMGNDEHSLNVYKKAQELGLEPTAYCDRMEHEFRTVWNKLDVSYDDFIRTTESRHRVSVQTLIQRIHDAGDTFEGTYRGWYCDSCEGFKQEKDLEDGNCPLHRTKPTWLEETNHFFRLSKYREPLLEHYREHPGFLEPGIRRNEILNVIEGGLEDISISRESQKWGIPVPFDPRSVVYVWADAVINYISAVGLGHDEALLEKWWPCDLHVIGKDITRFHCILWPAMLLSAGLPLPQRVFGHGFVFFKGERMSKTLGTVVDPLDVIEKFGPDPLRLYLVREITYGQDGDFSWERFEARYNADLANNLGNLVSRIATMAVNYRDGKLVLPGPHTEALRSRVEECIETYRQSMEALALQAGAAAAYQIVDSVNEFITEAQPWVLARDSTAGAALDRVLFDAAEATRIASVLLLPIMPRSAAEILSRFGSSKNEKNARLAEDAVWGAGGELRIAKGDPIWPRL
ncbi:MAG TPA: methionine--tRNA ligase [Vicinamibacteria bacterium]|nr:methionine--tRNA ligase [Vicinamibacteria bacterium]